MMFGRRRRWILASALILVVCGLMGGAAIALRRGLKKEGLYEKGLRAMREHRPDEAEEYFRSVLAADPGADRARIQLSRVLLEGGRYEELDALASEWIETGAAPVLGWKLLIDSAWSRLRFAEAERLARSRADLDPEYAQLTVIQVRDAMGSFWDRYEAYKTALNLAATTESDITKAETLLYAGETLLDLAAGMTDKARRRAETEARRHLEEAGKAARRARQVREGARHDLLLARIQVRSDTAREAEVGADTLKFALENDPLNHTLRTSLATYHMERGEWAEALTRIRELKDQKGPYLDWLRAVRRLASHGRRADVLELLDDPPFPQDPAVTLLRAQMLFRGDEADKTEAADLLTALVRKTKVDRRVAVAAYRMLVGSNREDAALEVLESQAGSDDLQLQALQATVLAAREDGSEQANELVAEIARRVASIPESLQVLMVLRQGGRASVERYLDETVEAGGELEAQHRLLRTVAFAFLALREPDAEGSGGLRTRAVEDLRVLRTLDLPKKDVVTAFTAALALGEFELAGRLGARALALDGPPQGFALGILTRAGGTEDAAVRAALAKGLREGADENGPRAFLEVLAAAVENRSARPDVAKALDTAKEEPASRVPSLYLAVHLAYLDGDADQAEASARLLREAQPDSEQARVLLADILLHKKSFAEVVELHGGVEGASFIASRQLAEAQWQLGDREKAIETARKCVRENPLDANAHLLLAELHVRDDRKDLALGVLGVAPATLEITTLRAGLLLDRGETGLAEVLYRSILEKQPAHLGAWRGLYALLTTEGRLPELLDLLSEGLGREGAEKSFRGELLVLRGRTLETSQRPGEALRDYEEVIGMQFRSVIALNNAAWIILEDRPERLDDAVSYVERALEIAPDHPNVSHTASMIYLRKGDYVRALECLDRVIDPKAPKPDYLFDRARILLALDRMDEAQRLLKRVRDEYAGTPAARKAMEQLLNLR